MLFFKNYAINASVFCTLWAPLIQEAPPPPSEIKLHPVNSSSIMENTSKGQVNSPCTHKPHPPAKKLLLHSGNYHQHSGNSTKPLRNPTSTKDTHILAFILPCKSDCQPIFLKKQGIYSLLLIDAVQISPSEQV